MRYDSRKWTGDRHASQRRRRSTRWVLVAGILIAAGYAVARMFPLVAPDTLWGFEAGVLFPVILGIRISPFGRDSWLTPRGLSVFDECERDMLQRASSYSYRVVLALLVCGLAWLAYATRFGAPSPRSWQQWASLAVIVTCIGAALPVLFAEFLVPLPPKGDVEEDL
ncbi:hypothetical protein [Sphingomonas azotifigens]|uniref:hypothetical protein n=1 Tax=Sphingomonas azotifigens TaxID=330920 RepID=UPI000A024662|nr:hypothetical protein [Sphingomonas azotifigens]